jgi:hypothetical protein
LSMPLLLKKFLFTYREVVHRGGGEARCRPVLSRNHLRGIRASLIRCPCESVIMLSSNDLKR